MYKVLQEVDMFNTGCVEQEGVDEGASLDRQIVLVSVSVL